MRKNNMDIYTVSLFGHRIIDDPFIVEEKLQNILYDLITEKEYVDFLLGRNGDFDILAASLIRQSKKKYDNGNCSMTLVLPYMTADIRNNDQSYLNYYDNIEICEQTSFSYYKAAIQNRNKCMVDHSDLVLFYVDHNSGGAYNTMVYAKKKNKNMINIAHIK